MSSITTPNHAQNISHYVAGLARQPGALDQLTLSLLAMPDEWRKLAMHRLHMRQTALLDVMSDAELEAIGTGEVDMWQITQKVAAQRGDAGDGHEEGGADNTDPKILELIEQIAKRKFGRTLEVHNRDRYDFFEVNVMVLKDALLTALLAGMQLKSA